MARRPQKPYITSPGTDPPDHPPPPCIAYAVVRDGWARRIRLMLAMLPDLKPRPYARHVGEIVATASLGPDRPRWWGVVVRGRARNRTYTEIDSAVLQWVLAVSSPAQIAALDRDTVRRWLRSPSAAVRSFAIAVLHHLERRTGDATD